MSTQRKDTTRDEEALVNFRAKRHLVDDFRAVVESEERTLSQDLRRYMAERVLAANGPEDAERAA